MNPYIRPDSISIDIWIANFERLKELDIEWVVPGHGAISKPVIIDVIIQYLQSH